MTTSTTRPPADTDALLSRTLGLVLEPTFDAQELYAVRDAIAGARAEAALRLADGIIVALGMSTGPDPTAAVSLVTARHDESQGVLDAASALVTALIDAQRASLGGESLPVPGCEPLSHPYRVGLAMDVSLSPESPAGLASGDHRARARARTFHHIAHAILDQLIGA